MSKAWYIKKGYFDDLLVVVDFEHSSGEGFDVDVGFSEFDITVEITEVFGFHVHALEDGDETKDSELFVGFVGVVVDLKLLLHFTFDSVDSFLMDFDFGVVVLQLSFELANDKDRMFKQSQIPDL